MIARTHLALAVFLCAVACGPRPSRPPGGGGSTEPPAITPTPAAARAFRVTRPEDLLPGPAASGAVGDFRLDNGRVAFVVTDVPISYGFADTGGNLVDAAAAGGRDSLSQIFLYLDDTFPRQALYATLEVTAAGGEEAVLTARGRDSADEDLAITTEYRLRAGDDALLLRTTVENRGADAVAAYEVGDAIQWGHAERFIPGLGLRSRGRRKAAWLGGIGDGVGYAYATGAGEQDGLHGSSWSDSILATCDLPPGEYRVAATAPGRASVFDDATAASTTGELVAVPARGAVRDLAVTRPAWLELAITSVERPGAAAAPSPAKLTFVAAGETPSPWLGPRYRASGAGNVVLTATGGGRVALPPGRYTAWVSRGIEYDLARVDLELAPGDTRVVAAELHRVVDTTGYLSADFHQHAVPSPDSAVALVDRLTANLAEGVEIAVATDHNEITDYGRAAAALHAGGRLAVVSGLEATTETVGHFNAYPLARAERAGRGGAPAVEGRTPAEIFSALRALAPDLVVQVNHPRAGRTGYFDALGFDVAAADQPAALALGFDAIEVLNGKRVEAFDRLLRDWFWLLDHGVVATATGNSDSHAIIGEEVGYPRTFVGVGHDDPARLDGAAILEGVKRRRDVIATNGPFVTVRAAGESAVGRTFARRRGQPLEVELVVQAAPWVDVDRIEIYANGVLAGEPLPVAPTADVVRFRATLRWTATTDTYYVIVVRGDASLAPVVPAGDTPVTPVAVVNPVWIDVN